MSLPSTMTFLQGETEVGRMSVNCGWFCNKPSVLRAIIFSIGYVSIPKNSHLATVPEDWTHVVAYGETFTKEEILEGAE